MHSSDEYAPRLLDVGCGDGSFALQQGWADKYQYTGVDIDPEKVREARDRGLEATESDVVDGLNYDDEEFDVVVAKAILEHVDDPVAAVKECRRVLGPSGRFRAIVPSDRSYDIWGDYSHKRAFRRDALLDLLSDAGFDRSRADVQPRMGWGSLGMAVKSCYRILAPWTPYGYPRAWDVSVIKE